MQRAGGGGGREQAAARQRKPGAGNAMGRGAAGGREKPGAGNAMGRGATDRQPSLAEKLLLEQSIAHVVGGQTGLLMALDMLLHDAKEKDSAGFLCHAEGYLRRAEKLEPLFLRYRKIAGQGAEYALYDSLLKVGRNLRKKLSEISTEGLSDKELDTWRRSVLRHVELYGERSPAGGDRSAEG